MGRRQNIGKIELWNERENFLYGFKPNIPKFHYSPFPAFEA